MKFRAGQKFTTKNGGGFEILEVLPFGQLEIGVRKQMSGGFSPVVRQWSNTQHSLRSQIDNGEIREVLTT